MMLDDQWSSVRPPWKKESLETYSKAFVEFDVEVDIGEIRNEVAVLDWVGHQSANVRISARGQAAFDIYLEKVEENIGDQLRYPAYKVN